MSYPKWLRNSLENGSFKDNEDGMIIYRVGQALFNVTVFNKKSSNLLKSRVEHKYRTARRYAGYVKDVVLVTQVIKMLINEKKRNSYKKIIVKLKKNCQRYNCFRCLIPALNRATKLYSNILSDLNPDNEMASALYTIMSDGCFNKNDKSINDLFVKQIQMLGKKIEKLVNINYRLIDIYFSEIQREENVGYKYQCDRLKIINKAMGKHK